MTDLLSPLKFVAHALQSSDGLREASLELTGIGAQSLADLAGSMRVQPITLVDRKLTHLPYLSDINQACVSIFSGYYMQAFTCLNGVTVNGINTIKLLDALNPSRDFKDSFKYNVNLESIADEVNPLGSGFSLKEASYKYQLPKPGQHVGMESYSLGLEADDMAGEHRIAIKPDRLKEYKDSEARLKEIEEERNKGVKATFSNSDLLREATNLSVGKMFEVTLGSGDKQMKLPISVRLLSSSIESDVVASILANGGRDLSVSERFHQWQVGLITWRDLVFGTDLIDERRKVLIKDKQNMFKAILDRRNNNLLKTLFTGNRSYATASNIILISDATRREVERQVMGKLSNPSVRETIFNRTYLILLVVVDPEEEVVTIYHRNIKEPTELTLRDIKGVAKTQGVDITQMMQSFLAGKAPSF